MQNAVVKQVMALPSSTLSELIGSSNKRQIDSFHDAFIDYVEGKSTDMWKDWKDAYMEFKRFTSRDNHSIDIADCIRFEEEMRELQGNCN